MRRSKEGTTEMTKRGAAEAIGDILPPAYSIHCTKCGKRFPLRARIKDGIRIRCTACGRLFITKLERPGAPREVEPHEQPARVRDRRRSSRSPGMPEDPRGKVRRRIGIATGVAVGMCLLGLFLPSLHSGLPERQWDVEIGLAGGKKATFALYGKSANQIEYVCSSFDGGPFATDSSWKSFRDEARMLPGAGAKESASTAVEFRRAEEPWKIQFSGEGRAKVDRAGKTLWGTVVRPANLP